MPTPGTSMAGLDCAEISSTAWPSLRAGMAGTITVSDADVHAEMRSLAAARTGDRRLRRRNRHRLRRLAEAEDLSAAVGFGPSTRALLIATEGPTDPDAYARSSAATADLGQASIQSTLFAAPAVEHDPPGLPWLARTQTNPWRSRVVTVLRAPDRKAAVAVARLRVTFFAAAHGHALRDDDPRVSRGGHDPAARRRPGAARAGCGRRHGERSDSGQSGQTPAPSVHGSSLLHECGSPARDRTRT